MSALSEMPCLQKLYLQVREREWLSILYVKAPPSRKGVHLEGLHLSHRVKASQV